MKILRIRPVGMPVFILALIAVLFGATQPAFAQAKTLGDMTNNVYDSLLSLQTFLSVISYTLGVFFSMTALQLLRNYVDDPGRNPIQVPLLRMAAAAFFIFLPTFADILITSIGGGNQNLNDAGGAATITKTTFSSGKGLDYALGRFVADFAGPFLENLLPFFAYVSGVVFMLIGLKRLAQGAGDGPQGPGGLGTIGTFVVAAGLMAFGYVMYIMQGSIFGTTNLYTNQAFVNNGSVNAAMETRATQTLWGVFMFLRIVGYISVLRGLFMLRGAAEGGNVSMMAVGTHMIAGSLLANIGAFVNAVQYSFLGDTSNFVFKAF